MLILSYHGHIQEKDEIVNLHLNSDFYSEKIDPKMNQNLRKDLSDQNL